MGKHKNATQNALLLRFMEEQIDIAKGFTKRDKPLVESLWQQLAEALNSAGPPQKDAKGWKKVWIEWKSEVNKKMAHNQVEARATGAGPFAKHVLNQSEETIVRICGIAQSVAGVSRISVGTGEEEESDKELNEEPRASSSKRHSELSDAWSTPKRVRRENPTDRLKNYLDESNEINREMNRKLQQIVNFQKENVHNTRRVYRAIGKTNDTIAEIKQEFMSFGVRMLQVLQEKNEIKKQMLEIQVAKYELEKK